MLLFKKNQTVEKSDKNDLIIIGAGTLGSLVAKLWLDKYKGSLVTAETHTVSSHARLKQIGAVPRTRRMREPTPHANVLYCVPPSDPQEYNAEIDRAIGLWNRKGKLLFTSSSGVYAEMNGGTVTELSPIADNARAKVIIDAERKFLNVEGTVVRLAGLYDFDHGPHRVYLRTQTSDVRPDGLVNLIHYDDAATLCVSALEHGVPGSIYLGCDDYTITRKEMVDALSVSSITGAHNACRFTGKDGPLGQRLDNTFTRKILEWHPRFKSFKDWLTTL